MKKGCFFTIISSITILIMAGIYLYKTNKDFFQNFGKDKIINLASEEIENKIRELKNTPYKDSLVVLLHKYAKKIDNNDFETAMNEFGLIADKMRLVINDGVLDSTEFADVKRMVNKNERPEKNRN